MLTSHTLAIHVELVCPLTTEQAKQTLSGASEVKLQDVLTPSNAAGIGPNLTGRIRQNRAIPDNRGLIMVVCGDDLRKGAALNAVQLAGIVVAQLYKEDD